MSAVCKPKVLLVDDEPVNIQLLSELLRDEGYEMFFATNGAAALERAAAGQPDLMVLDVMMPDMDGFEVCARLKADSRTRDIAVIFATALGQEEDVVRGLSLGAVDYITKPISPPITLARIRNHIELKLYRDRLQEQAMEDALTGLANRRVFDDTLLREWTRSRRMRTRLALLLFDVDHFKAYNDTYGHGGGDDCLRAVAHALADVPRRPTDLVARIGGEEFACLLPGTDAEGAARVAETMLAAVRALAIPHSGSSAAAHVTISIGGASLVAGDDDPPRGLLEAADGALYAAKAAGRDRAAAAEPAAKLAAE